MADGSGVARRGSCNSASPPPLCSAGEASEPAGQGAAMGGGVVRSTFRALSPIHNRKPERTVLRHGTGEVGRIRPQPTPPHIHVQRSTRNRSPITSSIGARTSASDHTSSGQTIAARRPPRDRTLCPSSFERVRGTRPKTVPDQGKPDPKSVGGGNATLNPRHRSDWVDVGSAA